MNPDCIRPTSSNFEIDQLRRELKSVFRILANPEHDLREKAIERRQELSCTWGTQAAEGKWFPWPTTVATRGVRGLKGAEWRQDGMLSYLGYHVGQTQPTSREIRWSILAYAFECHLPPLNGPIYYSAWGKPETAQRLKKLANTLAALARNAKGRDDTSYAAAIDHWERDLAHLHERYYVDFFHFGWPQN
jgi:hypothetical protein